MKNFAMKMISSILVIILAVNMLSVAANASPNTNEFVAAATVATYGMELDNPYRELPDNLFLELDDVVFEGIPQIVESATEDLVFIQLPGAEYFVLVDRENGCAKLYNVFSSGLLLVRYAGEISALADSVDVLQYVQGDAGSLFIFESTEATRNAHTVLSLMDGASAMPYIAAVPSGVRVSIIAYEEPWAESRGVYDGFMLSWRFVQEPRGLGQALSLIMLAAETVAALFNLYDTIADRPTTPHDLVSIIVLAGAGGNISTAADDGHGQVSSVAWVHATAIPYDGFAFDGWWMDGRRVSNYKIQSFTATQHVQIRAKFREIPPPGQQVDLFVTTSPRYGGIVDGRWTTASFTELQQADTHHQLFWPLRVTTHLPNNAVSVERNARVELTAIPDIANGYYFAGWFDGDDMVGQNKTITVTTNRTHSLQARFSQPPRRITLNVSATAHGEILRNHGGQWLPVQSGSWLNSTAGSVVDIQAVPSENFEFSHWTASCASIVLPNRNETRVTFTVPYNDVEITAHFTAAG